MERHMTNGKTFDYQESMESPDSNFTLSSNS